MKQKMGDGGPMSKAAARRLVLAEINKPGLADPAPDCGWPMPVSMECLILDEHTIEREWGWVFFYQSREFVETGEARTMLSGNAPIIVCRHDGTLRHTGTALPVEKYIEEYEVELANGKKRADIDDR